MLKSLTDHRYDNKNNPNPSNNDKDPNHNMFVYESEKPGYDWSDLLGYVPSNGGTGGTQTGDDMPGDQSTCVFNENGNCTVHQHSGY